VGFDPETGDVDREQVIQVLRHYKLGASDDPDNPGCIILAKELILESVPLPNPVSRKMLHYFQRTYGIAIHHFYHPDMMT
jgi:hypothetical protein